MDLDRAPVGLDPQEVPVKSGMMVATQGEAVPHGIRRAWRLHGVDVSPFDQSEVQAAQGTPASVSIYYILPESRPSHEGRDTPAGSFCRCLLGRRDKP